MPELEFLLDCIKDVEPLLGPDEWERVAEAHALGYPECNHDALSLRCKFQEVLYNMWINALNMSKRQKDFIIALNSMLTLQICQTLMPLISDLLKKEDTTNNELAQGEPPADDTTARVLFQAPRSFTVTRTTSTTSSGGRNAGSASTTIG